MEAFEIVIRCTRNSDHAKKIRVDASKEAWGQDAAEGLAALLDGTSPLYIHKPGPNSPIGKCATCGGPLTSTVERVQVKDAKPKK